MARPNGTLQPQGGLPLTRRSWFARLGPDWGRFSELDDAGPPPFINGGRSGPRMDGSAPSMPIRGISRERSSVTRFARSGPAKDRAETFRSANRPLKAPGDRWSKAPRSSSQAAMGSSGESTSAVWDRPRTRMGRRLGEVRARADGFTSLNHSAVSRWASRKVKKPLTGAARALAPIRPV